MGHSAGGHLALLYAYMAKQENYNYGDNIQLVISEAGPTDFTNFEGINTNNVDIRNGFMLSLAQLSALTGAEYTIDNYENNTEYPGGWEDASPIYHVSTNQGNNFPYTILAYGSNVNTPQGNNPFISGDGTVPYSQATSLMAELDPTFEDTSNGSETNASQVIEGENCTLFKLYEVGHNDFGTGTNNKKIYPTSNNPNSIMYFSGLEGAIEDYLKE